MAMTPRKAADTGFDKGGNVTGAPKQGAGEVAQSQQSDNPSGQGESCYTRKATGLNASNLPFKRQPQGSQVKAG